MKPFTMPVCCEVCGGEGLGTIETAGAAWHTGRHRYSEVRHRDPRVCADVLARRARELRHRELALAEAEASW
jgi:hypothetical protein